MPKPSPIFGVWWPRRALAALAQALGCTIFSPNTAAESGMADENRVKAGFVFNFVKYANWPPTLLLSDLKLCSLSNAPLDGQLDGLQGRRIHGVTLQVKSSVRPSELRDCHVVFISAQEVGRLDFILAQTANLPILTVSDAPGFVQSGGMIGLKVMSDRVHFDVNLAVARRATLGLSGNMIKLAGEVLK